MFLGCGPYYHIFIALIFLSNNLPEQVIDIYSMLLPKSTWLWTNKNYLAVVTSAIKHALSGFLSYQNYCYNWVKLLWWMWEHALILHFIWLCIMLPGHHAGEGEVWATKKRGGHSSKNDIIFQDALYESWWKHICNKATEISIWLVVICKALMSSSFQPSTAGNWKMSGANAKCI